MTEEQLASDIEAMLHEDRIETAPEWSGAPLRFTTAYYPPEALDAAVEHWQSPCTPTDETHVNSRTWHGLDHRPWDALSTGREMAGFHSCTSMPTAT